MDAWYSTRTSAATGSAAASAAGTPCCSSRTASATPDDGYGNGTASSSYGWFGPAVSYGSLPYRYGTVLSMMGLQDVQCACAQQV